MDKIKAVKNKWEMPSINDVNLILNTELHRSKESLKEQERYLLDLNAKSHELKREVEIAKESLRVERQHLNKKEQDLAVFKNHLNELECDKKTLLLEVHQLDTQRDGIRNAKPNPKDQRTIELGMKKFNYYKELTGVRWDFGASKDTIKGYVTNGWGYIHGFAYKSNGHTPDLEDLLWKEIEKASDRSSISKGDDNKTSNS